ncbi:MAG: hypothetical protein IIB65_11420, partial [Proteobacteria bacterium]|nr:hypothetical protein [Pseudomonadota bacterium]
MKTEPMMNRSHMMRTPFRIAGLPVILSLLLAPLVSVAHELDRRTEQTASSRADLPAARIAEIRDILFDLTDILYAIGAHREITRTMTSATQAHEALTGLTDEELALYADVMPQIQQLVVAVRNAETLVQLSVMDMEVSSRLAQAYPSAASSFPGEPFYSDECGDSRTATGTVRGLLIALQIGRGVHAALDRACGQVIVGFNAMLACIPADLILFGLETAYEQIAFCIEDIDSAEILTVYKRVGHLHTHLDSARSGVFTEGANSSSLWFNKTLIAGARDAIRTEILATGAAVVAAIEKFRDNILKMIEVMFAQQNLVLRAWRLDS